MRGLVWLLSASAAWNIVGLLLSLSGVVLLFKYGMPYRTRTGGANYYVASETDEEAKAAEARFDKLGLLGLALLVLGTIFQIVGALVPVPFAI